MTIDRRSSGRRFERPAHATNFSLVGALLCLAALPFAMIPVRARSVTVHSVQSSIVHLPDGSLAKLTKGTTVRYRSDFATRRTLWLFGGASIDAIPGSPFAVWTETAVIRTTGASLSIRAFDSGSTFVAVRAGTARVRALNEDNDPAYPAVTIGPGQHAFAVRTLGAHLSFADDR